MLKLFHGTDLIGTISNIGQEGFNMNGDISLTPNAQKFREVFEFFADEVRQDEEDPPFSDDLLYNWFIQKESGEMLEISIPTIYPDGLILWR